MSRVFVRRSRLLWVCLCLVGGIASGTVADEVRSEGTLRMAQRLAALRDGGDPMANPFLNRKRAELFGKQLSDLLSAPRRSVSRALSLYFNYGYELLHAGETRAAIKQFTRLNDLIRERQVALSSAQAERIKRLMILAHLRLGEQENCLDLHTTDSCLVPIQQAGFHRKPEGSRAAVRLLEQFLSRHPADLRSAWLLNIGYMTLGSHPAGVPPRYRIAPEVFDSEYELPRFRDVASELGLDWNSLAGSVVMDDLDGDLDLDLMVSGMGLDEQLQLYLNQGDGGFTNSTQEAGIVGELGGLNLIQGDYDNDGDLDILVLRGAWFEADGNHPNSLLRNRGNAVFDDVTEAAGLLSFHPTQAATWFDFDGDGWLDIFVGNETSTSAANPCELFHNQGDGTFVEIAQDVGLTGTGMVKAVASGDFDNDGRPDLYLSCRGQANYLYRNLGRADGSTGQWKFENVAPTLSVDEPVHSFPSWFFDYDNDGWLDLYSCGYGVRDVGTVAADYLGLQHGGARPRLYRNQGDGTFTNVTRETGLYRCLLGMAGNYGDIDNDGYLDFYLGTGTPQLEDIVPNRMLRNAGGERFQDVTTAGGFGHVQKGHGIAFGDLDNDGDQDVYGSLGGAYEGDHYFNALFENPGNGASWIKLLLEGTDSNRAAIGARIKVTIADPDGDRSIHRTVSSGGSFGASPLRQEIGLGEGVAQVTVEVWWPSTGLRQRFKDLRTKRLHRLREGDANAVALPLPEFEFKKAHSAHQHDVAD